MLCNSSPNIFWCLPITTRTSQQNFHHRRSQNGLSARRRMPFPSSTWLLMACVSHNGGEWCSPLANYSKSWVVHLTLFERLQRLKLGRDWKREVQLAYMIYIAMMGLLWWVKVQWKKLDPNAWAAVDDLSWVVQQMSNTLDTLILE